jgi:ribosome assembly protein 4
MTSSLASSVGKNGDKRTGGIAWAGSLVGSENPNNLGYRYSNPLKRYKKAGDNGDDGENDGPEFPSNLVVQFQNRQGDELANSMDIPTHSTIDDLQALVHSLIDNDDEDDEKSNNKSKGIPYSFYAKIERKNGVVDEIEITNSLLDFLKEYKNLVSTEVTLQLTYQPLAVFKVRPVTRCTATMPGHTEAILHVSYSPDGQHLASGGGDTSVRFWDVNTCLPKMTCKQHKDHVLCTAWSPDGRFFASADKRGTLIIWDPHQKRKRVIKQQNGTKSEPSEPIWIKSQAHKQYITGLAWEPLHLNQGRGERIVTSSKDGSCKIWNVRTKQALIVSFCFCCGVVLCCVVFPTVMRNKYKRE